MSTFLALLSGKAGRIWRIGVSQIQGMLAGISVVIWEGLAGVLPPSPAHYGNLHMEIIMEILGDVEHRIETHGPGLGGVTRQGHRMQTETPLTMS